MEAANLGLGFHVVRIVHLLDGDRETLGSILDGSWLVGHGVLHDLLVGLLELLGAGDERFVLGLLLGGELTSLHAHGHLQRRFKGCTGAAPQGKTRKGGPLQCRILRE